MRNDARAWHADTEGILAFLDISGIDAGGRNPNADLAGFQVEDPAFHRSPALLEPTPVSRTRRPSYEKHPRSPEIRSIVSVQVTTLRSTISFGEDFATGWVNTWQSVR